MRISAPRSIDELARSLQLVSALASALGVGLIIGPGYLNPLRFGKYFVVLGVVGFFLPGVLGTVAGVFLRNDRARWSWVLAVIACVAQFLVAGAGVVGQFFLSPISPVPLLACAAWLIASAYLLVQLVRWRFAVQSDVAHRRGFAVETAANADIQPND